MVLYVWENVLESWGHGIMFAWASSVDEARRLIIEKAATEEHSWKSFVNDCLAEYDKLLTDKTALDAFLSKTYDNADFESKYYCLDRFYDLLPDLLSKEPRIVTNSEGFLIYGSD